MKYPPLLILPIVLAVSQAWAETNPTPEETVTLSPVTVTGTQQEKANRVTFNPKAALQPLPAGDGADLLQSVPNMSIIRKGGSSGDPLFRGLGGSRLSVNADDQFIYGGCGMRMDPPTAYIHPTHLIKSWSLKARKPLPKVWAWSAARCNLSVKILISLRNLTTLTPP